MVESSKIGPATKTIGLTGAEVQERQRAGQSNFVPQKTSRRYSEILRANILTVFNAILTAAVIVVLAVGDPRDAVFGLVMVLNTVIGIVSEIRAKLTLDSVAVLQAPKSRVWRDGVLTELPSGELVCDDVIELRLGDQVPADGEVLSILGLEVDESILTGESLPANKLPGDKLLSGTAVVAGSGTMVARTIGKESWAQKITAEAKQFSLAVSEIQQSINKVLKWVTWMLPVVVALLIWSQMRVEGNDWRLAVVLAVAGVVGMIPQGLVLLTSLNFGMASATLARRGVLVQELPAVEILARVDRLCLDKTGTLTTGGIRGKEILTVDGPSTGQDSLAVLGWLTADQTNATSAAIQTLLGSPKSEQTFEQVGFEMVHFSSSRKWSAIVGKGDQGTWVLGAPEILLSSAKQTAEAEWVRTKVADASRVGNRTVCLGHAQTNALEIKTLPTNLQLTTIVVLEEDIRPDVIKTLEYFREQGVGVNVISGDAPATVAAIANLVGLRGPNNTEPRVIDARTLPPLDTPDFDQIVQNTEIYGRVTPDQKRGLVRSLQRQGHTVAMTGDGVNDALALKQADLGIAMGNGAPATKAVSRMVLLNDEFAVLPGVVAEGRRIIANMERVSSLFLSKTTYALLLAIIVAIGSWKYPFLPRHLTYMGWFTIGVPAFVLALAPSSRRYQQGFLKRTLLIAVPSGVIMGVVAISSYLLVGATNPGAQTAATMTMIIMAIWLLNISARPLVPWKIGLLVVMSVGALLGVVIALIRTFFALTWPEPTQWVIIICSGIIGAALIEITYRFTSKMRQGVA